MILPMLGTEGIAGYAPPPARERWGESNAFVRRLRREVKG